MPAAFITSANTPLEVSLLPDINLPGSIGISALPGRRSIGADPRFLEPGGELFCRSLVADLTRLREFYHTSLLWTLIETPEFDQTGTGPLLNRTPVHGIRSLWTPVRDHGVPASLEAYHVQVSEAVRHVAQGGNAVVHCRAGRGRAPTAVACMLVRVGVDAETAIDTVQRYRERALTRRVQQDYVHRYQRWLAGERGV